MNPTVNLTTFASPSSLTIFAAAARAVDDDHPLLQSLHSITGAAGLQGTEDRAGAHHHQLSPHENAASSSPSSSSLADPSTRANASDNTSRTTQRTRESALSSSTSLHVVGDGFVGNGFERGAHGSMSASRTDLTAATPARAAAAAAAITLTPDMWAMLETKVAVANIGGPSFDPLTGHLHCPDCSAVCRPLAAAATKPPDGGYNCNYCARIVFVRYNLFGADLARWEGGGRLDAPTTNQQQDDAINGAKGKGKGKSKAKSKKRSASADVDAGPALVCTNTDDPEYLANVAKFRAQRPTEVRRHDWVSVFDHHDESDAEIAAEDARKTKERLALEKKAKTAASRRKTATAAKSAKAPNSGKKKTGKKGAAKTTNGNNSDDEADHGDDDQQEGGGSEDEIAVRSGRSRRSVAGTASDRLNAEDLAALSRLKTIKYDGSDSDLDDDDDAQDADDDGAGDSSRNETGSLSRDALSKNKRKSNPEKRNASATKASDGTHAVTSRDGSVSVKGLFEIESDPEHSNMDLTPFKILTPAIVYPLLDEDEAHQSKGSKSKSKSKKGAASRSKGKSAKADARSTDAPAAITAKFLPVDEFFAREDFAVYKRLNERMRHAATARQKQMQRFSFDSPLASAAAKSAETVLAARFSTQHETETQLRQGLALRFPHCDAADGDGTSAEQAKKTKSTKAKGKKKAAAEEIIDPQESMAFAHATRLAASIAQFAAAPSRCFPDTIIDGTAEKKTKKLKSEPLDDDEKKHESHGVGEGVPVVSRLTPTGVPAPSGLFTSECVGYECPNCPTMTICPPCFRELALDPRCWREIIFRCQRCTATMGVSEIEAHACPDGFTPMSAERPDHVTGHDEDSLLPVNQSSVKTEKADDVDGAGDGDNVARESFTSVHAAINAAMFSAASPSNSASVFDIPTPGVTDTPGDTPGVVGGRVSAFDSRGGGADGDGLSLSQHQSENTKVPAHHQQQSPTAFEIPTPVSTLPLHQQPGVGGGGGGGTASKPNDVAAALFASAQKPSIIPPSSSSAPVAAGGARLSQQLVSPTFFVSETTVDSDEKVAAVALASAPAVGAAGRNLQRQEDEVEASVAATAALQDVRAASGRTSASVPPSRAREAELSDQVTVRDDSSVKLSATRGERKSRSRSKRSVPAVIEFTHTEQLPDGSTVTRRMSMTPPPALNAKSISSSPADERTSSAHDREVDGQHQANEPKLPDGSSSQEVPSQRPSVSVGGGSGGVNDELSTSAAAAAVRRALMSSSQRDRQSTAPQTPEKELTRVSTVRGDDDEVASPGDRDPSDDDVADDSFVHHEDDARRSMNVVTLHARSIQGSDRRSEPEQQVSASDDVRLSSVAGRESEVDGAHGALPVPPESPAPTPPCVRGAASGSVNPFAIPPTPAVAAPVSQSSAGRVRVQRKDTPRSKTRRAPTIQEKTQTPSKRGRSCDSANQSREGSAARHRTPSRPRDDGLPRAETSKSATKGKSKSSATAAAKSREPPHAKSPAARPATPAGPSSLLRTPRRGKKSAAQSPMHRPASHVKDVISDVVADPHEVSLGDTLTVCERQADVDASPMKGFSSALAAADADGDALSIVITSPTRQSRHSRPNSQMPMPALALGATSSSSDVLVGGGSGTCSGSSGDLRVPSYERHLLSEYPDESKERLELQAASSAHAAAMGPPETPVKSAANQGSSASRRAPPSPAFVRTPTNTPTKTPVVRRADGGSFSAQRPAGSVPPSPGRQRPTQGERLLSALSGVSTTGTLAPPTPPALNTDKTITDQATVGEDSLASVPPPASADANDSETSKPSSQGTKEQALLESDSGPMPSPPVDFKHYPTPKKIRAAMRLDKSRDGAEPSEASTSGASSPTEKPHVRSTAQSGHAEDSTDHLSQASSSQHQRKESHAPEDDRNDDEEEKRPSGHAVNPSSLSIHVADSTIGMEVGLAVQSPGALRYAALEKQHAASGGGAPVACIEPSPVKARPSGPPRSAHPHGLISFESTGTAEGTAAPQQQQRGGGVTAEVGGSALVFEDEPPGQEDGVGRDDGRPSVPSGSSIPVLPADSPISAILSQGSDVPPISTSPAFSTSLSSFTFSAPGSCRMTDGATFKLSDMQQRQSVLPHSLGTVQSQQQIHEQPDHQHPHQAGHEQQEQGVGGPSLVSTGGGSRTYSTLLDQGTVVGASALGSMAFGNVLQSAVQLPAQGQPSQSSSSVILDAGSTIGASALGSMAFGNVLQDRPSLEAPLLNPRTRGEGPATFGRQGPTSSTATPGGGEGAMASLAHYRRAEAQGSSMRLSDAMALLDEAAMVRVSQASSVTSRAQSDVHQYTGLPSDSSDLRISTGTLPRPTEAPPDAASSVAAAPGGPLQLQLPNHHQHLGGPSSVGWASAVSASTGELYDGPSVASTSAHVNDSDRHAHDLSRPATTREQDGSSFAHQSEAVDLSAMTSDTLTLRGTDHQSQQFARRGGVASGSADVSLMGSRMTLLGQESLQPLQLRFTGVANTTIVAPQPPLPPDGPGQERRAQSGSSRGVSVGALPPSHPPQPQQQQLSLMEIARRRVSERLSFTNALDTSGLTMVDPEPTVAGGRKRSRSAPPPDGADPAA